jgi:hypothetical protein
MSVKKHTCNICNKDYKSSQSLWNHKNKIHNNEKNDDQNMTTNMTNTNHTVTNNDHIMTNNEQIINNIDDIEEKNLTENTICKFCNKKLSAYTHLRRHLKTCKKKNDIEKENEELKKEMDEVKQSLEELKKIMLEMMNKKCKMHPKTLQKMINNTNSHNNITINNNIQYVEYGREDLDKVFSKKEKMKILSDMGSPLENIIKYTHLNDKYPQFQSIIITNAKGEQAYAYNQELNKFILCNKTELLEDLIVFRFDDLIDFYEQCKYNLSPKLRESLEKTFLLKDDIKCNKIRCNELNVIIYNQCNKDNIKYKPIDNTLEEDINFVDC